jgi:Sporulation and spore germination/Immunoglobulin-like domain of bacterial spore germination
MKALLVVPAAVLAASLGFLVASCGTDDEATPAGPVPAVSTAPENTTVAPPATEETPTEPVPSITEGQVTYEVWFTDAEGLFLTYQTGANLPRVGTTSLEALLSGPDSFEEDYGLRSEIPDGTQLLGLEIEDGVAHVDLSSEFESGGGIASMQARLAQVVYTLTQFPTVKGVLFSLDGVQIGVPKGESIIERPMTRRDYAELLPAILVTSPALNQSVDSPVVIRGSANVFEANVSIEILDEEGNVLAETFTTATCGTGCRGTFRTRVPYEIDAEQMGTIVVHDDDTLGTGTPPHEVRIPVRLVP